MYPVQKVRIIRTEKLFKEGEEANAIELAFNDVNNFSVVVAKSQEALNKEGIYIQPDFCLSDIPIFDLYIRPDGNGNKSRLGRNFRIKAIKFNFQQEGMFDPIFSMGIFLTRDILNEYYPDVDYDMVTEEELTELLGVIKYEEPEKTVVGSNEGEKPSFLYMTDETNGENLKKHVDKEFASAPNGKIECYLSVKVDGSSITEFYKDENIFGICSRKLQKKLDAKETLGYIIDNELYTKFWNSELRQRGWFNQNTNIFYNDEEMAAFEPKEIVEKELKDVDTFVKYGLPVLNRFKQWCKDNNFTGALRGELYGQGQKGSGNKLNPHSSLPVGIKFYGLDDLSSGVAVRVPLNALRIEELKRDLEIDWCDIICEDYFTSYDELKAYCNEYFKTNMIEGIVVRSSNDNRFSFKIMNLEYDARK